MLQRNIRGFVWISLVLASFLIALAVVIYALLEKRPDSFEYHYRLQLALSMVSSYVRTPATSSLPSKRIANLVSGID